MTVGGVEKALLGLLTKFPNEEYDVTIVLQEKIGDYLNFIPPTVKVVEHEEWKKVCYLLQKPLHTNALIAFKKGRIFKGLYFVWLWLIAKITGTHYSLHQYIQKQLHDYPGKYDLAIDYAGPTSFTAFFVANHVKAKEKWTWIHFDIDRFGIDKKVVEKIYSKYDKINIVSYEGKKHFDRKFPQFESRTQVYHNIIDQESIKVLAEVIPNPYQKIHAETIICTVGRISKEKGQLITITALKNLIDKGYDIHWCYVGEGTDLEKCKKIAEEYGISDKITFLGLQINPYPWMKYCDIYVQPSVHEGFCITLGEAKVFNVPIVCTSFTGAKEQLENYSTDYVIVEYDAQLIQKGIEKIIQFLKR